METTTELVSFDDGNRLGEETFEAAVFHGGRVVVLVEDSDDFARGEQSRFATGFVAVDAAPPSPRVTFLVDDELVVVEDELRVFVTFNEVYNT